MLIRSILAANPGPFTLDGTRTYLIGDEGVIDPGPEIASHIDAIVEAAPRLRTILITHRHLDHAPAAVSVKRRTGAQIWAPPGCLPAHEVDHLLTDGQVISVGSLTLQTIATPGHTSEHVCFITPDGDLFSGDCILGSGTTTIYPPDGDMTDYMRSLARLRTVAPRRILPGHGPIHQDALALIDYYIAHRLEREAQIIAALRAPSTVPAMRHGIYPDLQPALEHAAEIQLTAHLTKLLREGRVREAAGVYSLSEDSASSRER
jgi:glyoxylase-like metal-dependent hydrolase (beta-lactamase superfamily II)